MLSCYLASYLFRQQVTVFDEIVESLATIALRKVRKLIETRLQIRKSQSKEIDSKPERDPG